MQAAAMPLDSVPPQTETAPRWGALRIVLLILAIVETLNALSNVPVLFGDLSEIPGPGLGGWTIAAIIAISPIVAITALVFALTGRIPHAIVAIATLGLLGWLNYLPSVVLHGLEYDTSYGSLQSLVQFFVFPVLCLAAIRLALRNQRLGLATLMAAVPTLAAVVSVITFGVAVAIYGF
jgi:hypothetical protein